jgi:uncharacterized protein (DUF58 family)
MIRRLQLLAIAAVVIVAAFSTGLPFLFYLVYLGVLVVGGSYVLTRLALVNLEAGYAVSQLYGHVGDQLRVTYTLRNTGLLPKPWLEVHNPTTLPGGLAGRAISLSSRGERSWQVRVPLTRRGSFRIDALDVRSGDPFGFFEASASVGQGVSLIVYPRVEALPHWRLPTAMVEGSHAQPERTLQTTPLATTVRPWAPGDSFNRIHWKTTARHGEIQVKEFDLEQTADAWIFLDLESRVQAGEGDESTVEVAVRAAASIADRALVENRAVGLTTTGLRAGMLPADRGSRQHLKVMQLLAAVEGDGVTPLAEGLVQGLPRLRRGMTAVVITPSVDRAWVRPLASLRPRGVASVVVTLDAPSYAAAALAGTHGTAAEDATRAWAAGDALPSQPAAASAVPDAQQVRALRHALAEYDLRTYTLRAGSRLAEVLSR